MRRKDFRIGNTFSTVGHAMLSSTYKEPQKGSPHFESTIDLLESHLQDKEDRQRVNFRIKKHFERRHTTEVDEKRNSRFMKDLSSAKSEIKSLRKQIKKQRQSQQKERGLKFDHLISKVEEISLANRSPLTQQPPMPIYMPFPMPFYSPQQPQHTDSSRHTRYNKTFHRNRDFRSAKHKRNMRNWRKAANCALFVAFLRRFCRVAQKQRKVDFNNMKGKIKKQLGDMRKGIQDSMEEFVSVLQHKKNISLDIDSDDDTEVRGEKVSTIKKLCGVILRSLLGLARSSLNRKGFVQTIYYLCRHGSYACTEPLLTQEEMELNCISPKYHYLSADQNLEKSGVINLLLIKLLLYNNLLSEKALGAGATEGQSPNTIRIVASVLYQLFLYMQDELLMRLPPYYQLNNYKAVGKVRVLESIVLKGSVHREGELISGLRDEKWVQKYFKVEKWKGELRIVQGILNAVHDALKQFHAQSIVKYY